MRARVSASFTEPMRNSTANRFLCAEAGEGGGCRGAGVERGREVIRHLHALLPVRGIPPPVGLRPLDLGVAAVAHAAVADQPRDMVPIDLRPEAARAPGAVVLQKVVVVEAAAGAVDPAVAERDIERIHHENARLRRAGLAHAEPHAVGLRGVRLEPAFPFGDVVEGEHGAFGVRDHALIVGADY